MVCRPTGPATGTLCDSDYRPGRVVMSLRRRSGSKRFTMERFESVATDDRTRSSVRVARCSSFYTTGTPLVVAANPASIAGVATGQQITAEVLDPAPDATRNRIRHGHQTRVGLRLIHALAVDGLAVQDVEERQLRLLLAAERQLDPLRRN